MKIILLLLLGLLAGGASAKENTLEFAGDSAGFSLSSRKWNLRGTLYVLERGSAKRLPLSGTMKNGHAVFRGDGFEWKIRLRKANNLHALEGEVVNSSGRQRLLELGIALDIPSAKESAFWGGFDVMPAGKKEIARRGFKGRTSKHLSGGLLQPFPTAALIYPDHAVILGERQFECTSYHASVYRPLENGRAELAFSRRVVLEAEESVPILLACGIVPVRFGAEENVVQAFYDAFPENWRPFTGVRNRYIRGTHSQYSAWARRPDREYERRKFSTLDWAYTPYKRSGDCYGRPEFWDYKPLVKPFAVRFGQLAAGINFDYRKLSCAEFHQRRKEIFHRYGRKFGYSFYVCAGWCELQLAESQYPDSLTEDNSVPLILGPWSTSHDRERRVFPLGNRFGKAFREDLANVARELDLPGFAIDCGTPGVNHYGAAAHNPEVKGRSWDEKGIFIDELCAINQVIDYIHALRPEDPLYVWKNGNGKADILMIETDLFSRIFQSWMPLTRYNIGQRPAVLHVREGWMFQSTIPEWRTLTLDEMMTRLDRLGDHMTFSDFEYGMTQSQYGYGGNRQSQYCMPELLECINLGWHALIPVATDGLGDRMLYRARYGRGADTILFFGNPYEKSMKLNFSVDAGGLAGRHLVFLPKMRDSAALLNHIRGTDTTFAFALPSRLPVLFESVAELSNLPESGELQLEAASRKEIDEIVFTLRMRNNPPFRSKITPRAVPGFSSALKINGTDADPRNVQTLPANSVLELVYRSDCFRIPATEITSFPFTNPRNQPDLTILLPENPNAAERDAAERLTEYFRFAAEKKITGKSLVKVVSSGAPESTKAAIEINFRKKAADSGVFRKGKLLQIFAPDALTGYEFTDALLRVMDRRFPWFYSFGKHSRTSGEVIDKFELEKHPLPWDPCFETKKMIEK